LGGFGLLLIWVLYLARKETKAMKGGKK